MATALITGLGPTPEDSPIVQTSIAYSSRPRDIVERLPVELVIGVFYHIPATEVIAARRVSKRWNSLLTSEAVCLGLLREQYPSYLTRSIQLESWRKTYENAASRSQAVFNLRPRQIHLLAGEGQRSICNDRLAYVGVGGRECALYTLESLPPAILWRFMPPRLENVQDIMLTETHLAIITVSGWFYCQFLGDLRDDNGPQEVELPRLPYRGLRCGNGGLFVLTFPDIWTTFVPAPRIILIAIRNGEVTRLVIPGVDSYRTMSYLSCNEKAMTVTFVQRIERDGVVDVIARGYDVQTGLEKYEVCFSLTMRNGVEIPSPISSSGEGTHGLRLLRGYIDGGSEVVYCISVDDDPSARFCIPGLGGAEGLGPLYPGGFLTQVVGDVLCRFDYLHMQMIQLQPYSDGESPMRFTASRTFEYRGECGSSLVLSKSCGSGSRSGRLYGTFWDGFRYGGPDPTPIHLLVFAGVHDPLEKYIQSDRMGQFHRVSAYDTSQSRVVFDLKHLVS